jgi:hypothetical protein
VDAPPAVTLVGFAISVAVGGSLTTMVTVAGGLAPPAPVHVSENVASSPSTPVLRLPFAGKVPLQAPEALHEVVLAEDHVSVAEPPASMVVLDATRDAVGSAVTGVEPPQAQSTDTAPNKVNDAMNRAMNSMGSRSELVPVDRMSWSLQERKKPLELSGFSGRFTSPI